MLTRRDMLFGLAAATVTGCAQEAAPATPASEGAAGWELAAIEGSFGGRVGVFALDPGSGRAHARRADDRFAMCSTVLPVEALARAAVTVSNNTAANLLLAQVGGPAGLTAFIRAAGDAVTRLDRTEATLNANDPGDRLSPVRRPVETPEAMLSQLSDVHGATYRESRAAVIRDLREFYRTAEGGVFSKYLADFEQAVRESRQDPWVEARRDVRSQC